MDLDCPLISLQFPLCLHMTSRVVSCDTGLCCHGNNQDIINKCMVRLHRSKHQNFGGIKERRLI